MLTMLAQNDVGVTESAQQAPNQFHVVGSLFSPIDALAHPDRFAQALQQLSVVSSCVFLAAGLVCLLNGYRYYKLVTVCIAGSLGAFAGYYLGEQISAAEIVAGCLGVLMAVTCFPLMKYAIAVLGGLSGAFLGANVWSSTAVLLAQPGQVEAVRQQHWIGALIGLALCGLLAFVLFKLAIVLFTSVSGAMISVIGAIGLLLQVPAWRVPVTESISAHAIVVPLLVFVPAIIGLIVQDMGDGARAKTAK